MARAASQPKDGAALLEYKRAHYAANKERYRANHRAWQVANREKSRAIKRRWQKKNKKYHADWAVAAYRKEPEKYRERSKAIRKKNPEIVRERTRDWKARNPNADRAHKNNRRARKAMAGGSITATDIQHVIRRQKGKCASCGVKTKLQMDHILPLALGGPSDRKNIQGLCQRCNGSKHAKHPIDFNRSRGLLL